MAVSERAKQLVSDQRILDLELQDATTFTDFIDKYIRDHDDEAPVSDEFLITIFSRWYLSFLS
jgi:hypothetical protein